MILIYGMPSCPDCACVEEQAAHDGRYKIIDIGSDVQALKAFLRLRDSHDIFNEARQQGSIGIPCFVLDDGTVTLQPEEAGLHGCNPTAGPSCQLDGTGC